VRFLVTGAAGFIGSHLCERLLAEDHAVLGIDCFTDYYARSLKEENLQACRRSDHFELVEADLAMDDLGEALDGADGVFHLAAQPGVRSSWDVFETYVRHNFLATQRLMEAVRRRPLPLVYASSSSIYGDVERLPIREDDLPQPVSPYGVTKLAAEHIVSLYGRAGGIPVASVRYFTVYGPRQRPDMAFTRFLKAVMSGQEVELLGDGEQSRDFTYVADAVDATLRAMDHPTGGVYNVGGGTRATIKEVLAILEELTGCRARVRHRPKAAGDVTHTWADTAMCRRELNWEPRTSLRVGLEAQYRWLQASAALGSTSQSTVAR
jgi:UDP-glucose 4-epimerase